MTCTTCQQKRPDAAEIRRARALMCTFCIYAEHDADGPLHGQAITCTIGGRPVADYILSCQPSCPKGKHPDTSGIVRFAGVRWYGVPRFLRWLAAGRLTGAVPGCGCVLVLKNLWLRLKGSMIPRGFSNGNVLSD
jgi:hypothetical protein